MAVHRRTHRVRTPSVPYDERTPLMQLAGISNEDAAKRSLGQWFRQTPLEAPVLRPGARFYVTAVRGGKVTYLAGPYVSHMSAQAAVPTVKRMANLTTALQWHSVGTASRPDTVPTQLGHVAAGRGRGKAVLRDPYGGGYNNPATRTRFDAYLEASHRTGKMHPSVAEVDAAYARINARAGAELHAARPNYGVLSGAHRTKPGRNATRAQRRAGRR